MGGPVRSIFTTVLEVAGAGVVSVGLGLAWLPLGVISAGGAMLAFGFLAAVPPDRGDR